MIEKSKKIGGKKSIHHLGCFKNYFYYIFDLWRTFSALFLFCASRSLLLKPRKRSEIEIKPGRQGQPAGRSKKHEKAESAVSSLSARCTGGKGRKEGKTIRQASSLVWKTRAAVCLAAIAPPPPPSLFHGFLFARSGAGLGNRQLYPVHLPAGVSATGPGTPGEDTCQCLSLLPPCTFSSPCVKEGVGDQEGLHPFRPLSPTLHRTSMLHRNTV